MYYNAIAVITVGLYGCRFSLKHSHVQVEGEGMHSLTIQIKRVSSRHIGERFGGLIILLNLYPGVRHFLIVNNQIIMLRKHLSHLRIPVGLLC